MNLIFINVSKKLRIFVGLRVNEYEGAMAERTKQVKERKTEKANLIVSWQLRSKAGETDSFSSACLLFIQSFITLITIHSSSDLTEMQTGICKGTSGLV